MILVFPVGWKILAASFIVGVTLGVFLLIHVHLSLVLSAGGYRRISLIIIVMFFVQTLLDQCIDPAVALGRKVGSCRGIRYFYVSWLSYCFLVTATYRSNLINTFSQPPHTTHIQTFEDLALDNKTIAGIGRRSRPGQNSDVRAVLTAEAAFSTSYRKQETVRQLGEKYKKEDIDPVAIDILQGRYNYLDDAQLVEAVFGIMDKRFGVTNYATGDETLTVEEFWSVSYHAPRFYDIVKILSYLGESGILDHYRNEQEIVVGQILQNHLQIIFAKVFMQDEEDDLEDETPDDRAAWYERTKAKLAYFGLRNIAKFPKQLKTHNFVGLWLLLVSGLMMGGLIIIFEALQARRNGVVDATIK